MGSPHDVDGKVSGCFDRRGQGLHTAVRKRDGIAALSLEWSTWHKIAQTWMLYEYQEGALEKVMQTDSDWASCKVTRRSNLGGWLYSW